MLMKQGPPSGGTSGMGGDVDTAAGYGPLFARATPAANGRDTTRAAAQSIQPRAETLRARVLAYVIQQGQAGATDEELQTALGLRVQTETPRRGELVKLGLVRDSGRRRPTQSGRAAVVWVTGQGDAR